MLMWACPRAVAISEITPGRLGTTTVMRQGSPAVSRSAARSRSRPVAASATKSSSHWRSRAARARSTSPSRPA